MTSFLVHLCVLSSSSTKLISRGMVEISSASVRYNVSKEEKTKDVLVGVLLCVVAFIYRTRKSIRDMNK
jgi:hypothetical protein